MPTTSSQGFLDAHGVQTIAEFCRHRKGGALRGILPYGYGVQGYGLLTKIPAYYGLVWTSTGALGKDKLFGEEVPIVTERSKGWGDL